MKATLSFAIASMNLGRHLQNKPDKKRTSVSLPCSVIMRDLEKRDIEACLGQKEDAGEDGVKGARVQLQDGWGLEDRMRAW